MQKCSMVRIIRLCLIIVSVFLLIRVSFDFTIEILDVVSYANRHLWGYILVRRPDAGSESNMGANRFCNSQLLIVKVILHSSGIRGLDLRRFMLMDYSLLELFR